MSNKNFIRKELGSRSKLNKVEPNLTSRQLIFLICACNQFNSFFLIIFWWAKEGSLRTSSSGNFHFPINVGAQSSWIMKNLALFSFIQYVYGEDGGSWNELAFVSFAYSTIAAHSVSALYPLPRTVLSINLCLHLSQSLWLIWKVTPSSSAAFYSKVLALCFPNCVSHYSPPGRAIVQIR